jgi:hypothetical protein
MRGKGGWFGFSMVLVTGSALMAVGHPASAGASVVAPHAHHVHVPRAGRAVNVSHPDHIIGRGTPARCTSAAVVRAVAKGGIITFDCGPQPVTITMRRTAKLRNTSHRVVLDGGGRVTLSGAGKRRILYLISCD